MMQDLFSVPSCFSAGEKLPDVRGGHQVRAECGDAGLPRGDRRPGPPGDGDVVQEPVRPRPVRVHRRGGGRRQGQERERRRQQQGVGRRRRRWRVLQAGLQHRLQGGDAAVALLAQVRRQAVPRRRQGRRRRLGPPEREVLRRARAAVRLLRRRGVGRRGRPPPRQPQEGGVPAHRVAAVAAGRRPGVQEGARLQQEAVPHQGQVPRQGQAARHQHRVQQQQPQRRRRRRDVDMVIKIDGSVNVLVRHLQWKFRGNECISINHLKVQVYWDAHDWLFGTGMRNALFIFKPEPLPSTAAADLHTDEYSDFCLFLYAWKLE